MAISYNSTYVHFRSSLYKFVIVNNLAWTAMADSHCFALLIPYVCIFSMLSVNDLTAIDAKSSADTILMTNYLDFVPIPQSIYTIYTLRPEQNEWHVVVFMLSSAICMVSIGNIRINLCMNIYMSMHLDICSHIYVQEASISMHMYIHIARHVSPEPEIPKSPHPASYAHH